MPEDEDRKAILARRSRLVALALSSLAGAGCYESHPPGERIVTRDAGADTSVPTPCLGAPLDDAGPMVCLSRPFDAGATPCLDVALDAGADAEPGPCLSAPAPEDAGA